MIWVRFQTNQICMKSAGVISPNTNCGVAQIFATIHDGSNDVVSDRVSITVDGLQSLGCPQSTFHVQPLRWISRAEPAMEQ